MISNNLSAVEVASLLQSIVFVLFFIFFILVSFWAFTSRKEFINEMSNLPLEDGVVIKSDKNLKS